jgi:hypothetical protein
MSSIPHSSLLLPFHIDRLIYCFLPEEKVYSDNKRAEYGKEIFAALLWQSTAENSSTGIGIMRI